MSKILLGLGAALGLGLVGYGVYEVTKKSAAPAPTPPGPLPPSTPAPALPPSAPSPSPASPTPPPAPPQPPKTKLPPRGTMVLLRAETMHTQPSDNAPNVTLLSVPFGTAPSIEQVPVGLVLDVREVRELPSVPPYGPSPPGWGLVTFLEQTGWIRLDWAQWLPESPAPTPDTPPLPPIPGLPSPLPPPAPPPLPSFPPSLPSVPVPSNLLPAPSGIVRYLAPGDMAFPGRRYRGRAHLSFLERLAPDEVIRSAFEKQGFTGVRLWRDKGNLPRDWPSTETGSDLYIEAYYQGLPQAITFPPQVDKVWEQNP